MHDTRLIERWLPIAALGIESTRERTPMTPFPAPNRLHVWWARRPLVASRAAIVASVLPAHADRAKFMNVLGIHGDPVAAKGTDQNAAIHLYTHERACPEARSARGRGVSNNARARQRPWISAVSARADSRAA